MIEKTKACAIAIFCQDYEREIYERDRNMEPLRGNVPPYRLFITGFREVFGVSPMAYLKALRLQTVRTELQFANPATTAIAAIANRFCFQSLGHFSRDYKTMFGELPSQTLKQASRN